MKFVRTALGFTLALLALAATAEIQRWTDEHGVVHYGDKIPPEYAGRGSVQLNSQGVRVKEKSRELTDIERQQESQLQVQQREMARQREEQLRRDRSLIDTYANLDEIKRVRDRALESIDNAINVTQIRLTEIAKQKVALDEQLQHNLPQNRFIKLSAERDALGNEIRHLNDILIKRKAERQQTDQRYASDIQRYKDITEAVAARRKTTNSPTSSSSGETTTPSPSSAPTKNPLMISPRLRSSSPSLTSPETPKK